MVRDKRQNQQPFKDVPENLCNVFLHGKYGKMLHSQYITLICVCKQIYHTICRVVLPSPPYSFPSHLYSTAPVYFISFLQLDTLATFILSCKKGALSVGKNIESIQFVHFRAWKHKPGLFGEVLPASVSHLFTSVRSRWEGRIIQNKSAGKQDALSVFPASCCTGGA